jgi:ribosomal protein S1
MNNIESDTKITPAHVRPGFLVSGKVSKAYENGVEITFLGGITGTCFADHLDEETGLDKLKIGTKVTARIISVDPVSKVITTSMKKNIVGWSTKYVEETLSHLKVGQKFENVKV